MNRRTTLYGSISTDAGVLDMHSSVSRTRGAQEGSAFNGHFACTRYQPRFVFNQFGDLERCALQPGNVHSADRWHDVLEPVVARYWHRAPLLCQVQLTCRFMDQDAPGGGESRVASWGTASARRLHRHHHRLPKGLTPSRQQSSRCRVPELVHKRFQRR